jgi:hypothetical protein
MVVLPIEHKGKHEEWSLQLRIHGHPLTIYKQCGHCRTNDVELNKQLTLKGVGKPHQSYIEFIYKCNFLSAQN